MRQRSTRAAVVAVAAVACATTITGSPLASARPSDAHGDTARSSADRTPDRERKGNFDVSSASFKVLANQAVDAASENPAAVQRLSDRLGPQAVLDVDPTTGTPRNVGRLDGFLTGPSTQPAADVARSYVSDHLAAFGLTQADLSTLRLTRTYVDTIGIRHVYWTQVRDGIPVFGHGLRANVTGSGELLSVQGSPLPGLTTAKVSSTPQLSPGAARTAAVRDVGGRVETSSLTRSESAGANSTAWSNGDSARQVWFDTPAGLRLGWWTVTDDGDTMSYSHVIDADSGSVLYRRDLVQFDRGDAQVFDNYPGAPRGGQQRTVNLVDEGWIGRDAPWLRGAFVSAWADVNDDNAVNNNEKTPLPDGQFDLVPFTGNHSACGPSFVCTWDPDTAFSWQTNRNQDVTNAFFLASRYHDYLEQPPIGFTPDAGNFERVDRDPVELNALDGAAIDGGLPDGGHIDNANMATPPDGTPPRMQMYLWHTPGATEAEDPFLPVSGANDTSILYHEYTHGLSNRLVVDSLGNSTLNSIQAGSMGEAWSDYYAEDFLELNGFEPDAADTDGQVRVAKYTTGDRFTFRNMAMDCDPDSRVATCTDANGDHGYTYGDFATLPGGPEVHASGEIWAQTLWDLRERFGHVKADTLITRAMSLSPDDPSFLDMRNAILQADLVAFDGSDQAVIWQIFANRGMGYFAGSLGGGDNLPGEDFHVPPAPGTQQSTLSGQVTDPTTGEPVSKALVAITGHDSGLGGDLTDVTDDQGNYSIPNVFPGKYQKVAVLADGFEVGVTPVTVRRQPTTQDFEIRRDWAAASGGGQVADFNGPDFSNFGCGPGAAIDLSQGTGWGSTTGDDQGTPTNQMVPKFVTIHLPEPIDITAGDSEPAFSVDPSNTCGDAGSASTNGYRIEVSTDGGDTFTTVAEAEFGVGNRARFIDVPSNADVSGVTDVKFWMLSPQVPDFQTNCPGGNFSGCQFTDMTEIMVFGTPAT